MDKIRTFDLSYKSSLALLSTRTKKKETASRRTKHYETVPAQAASFNNQLFTTCRRSTEATKHTTVDELRAQHTDTTEHNNVHRRHKHNRYGMANSQQAEQWS